MLDWESIKERYTNEQIQELIEELEEEGGHEAEVIQLRNILEG